MKPMIEFDRMYPGKGFAKVVVVVVVGGEGLWEKWRDEESLSGSMVCSRN